MKIWSSSLLLNSQLYIVHCFLFDHRYIHKSIPCPTLPNSLVSSWILSPPLSFCFPTHFLWILQTHHAPYCFRAFVFPLIECFCLRPPPTPFSFRDLHDSAFMSQPMSVYFNVFSQYLVTPLELCYQFVITAFPTYLRFHFLQSQLSTANHSLKILNEKNPRNKQFISFPFARCLA